MCNGADTYVFAPLCCTHRSLTALPHVLLADTVVGGRSSIRRFTQKDREDQVFMQRADRVILTRWEDQQIVRAKFPLHLIATREHPVPLQNSYYHRRMRRMVLAYDLSRA